MTWAPERKERLLDAVLKEATGTFGQGRLQLLPSAVRIVRGKRVIEIPLSDVASVLLRPGGAWQSGFISFVAHGRSIADVAYAPDRDRTVHFVSRQQRGFEEIKRLVEEMLSGLAPSQEAQPVFSIQAAAEQVAAELENDSYAIESRAIANLQDSLRCDDMDVPIPSGPEHSNRASAEPGKSAPSEDEPSSLSSAPGYSGIVPELAKTGQSVAETLAGVSEPAVTLGEAIAVSTNTAGLLKEWVARASASASASGEAEQHPGLQFVLRAASRCTHVALKIARDAQKAGPGGRALFSRVSDPWPLLARAIEVEAAAASTLMILDAYCQVDEADLDFVRHSPMYEVLTAGAAATELQLSLLAQTLPASQPGLVEPVFLNISESLENLKAVIDERLADLSDLESSPDVSSARYLLTSATAYWKEGTDALEEGREVFLIARERWEVSARMVLERVDATMLHVLTAQAILSMADAYSDVHLPQHDELRIVALPR
jgi:hypothetical protein